MTKKLSTQWMYSLHLIWIRRNAVVGDEIISSNAKKRRKIRSETKTMAIFNCCLQKGLNKDIDEQDISIDELIEWFFYTCNYCKKQINVRCNQTLLRQLRSLLYFVLSSLTTKLLLWKTIVSWLINNPFSWVQNRLSVNYSKIINIMFYLWKFLKYLCFSKSLLYFFPNSSHYSTKHGSIFYYCLILYFDKTKIKYLMNPNFYTEIFYIGESFSTTLANTFFWPELFVFVVVNFDINTEGNNSYFFILLF